jgi:hypothetical protein
LTRIHGATITASVFENFREKVPSGVGDIGHRSGTCGCGLRVFAVVVEQFQS